MGPSAGFTVNRPHHRAPCALHLVPFFLFPPLCREELHAGLSFRFIPAGKSLDSAAGLLDNATGWNEINEPKRPYRQLQLDFSAPVKELGPAGAAQGDPLPGALRAIVRTRMATTGSLRAGTLYARSPAEAASLLAHIRKGPQEHLYVVAADATGKILEIHRYAKGTKNAASVNPTEVIGYAMNVPGAKRVFIAHNHPGGSPRPSPEDIATIRNIEAGLGMADIETVPIIIAGTKWASCHPHGGTDGIPPSTISVSLPIRKRAFKKLQPDEAIASSDEAARVKSAVYVPDTEGFLLVDNSIRVAGFLEHKPGRPMEQAAVDLIR